MINTRFALSFDSFVGTISYILRSKFLIIYLIPPHFIVNSIFYSSFESITDKNCEYSNSPKAISLMIALINACTILEIKGLKIVVTCKMIEIFISMTCMTQNEMCLPVMSHVHDWFFRPRSRDINVSKPKSQGIARGHSQLLSSVIQLSSHRCYLGYTWY